jgi:hypothetical protein
LIGCITAQIPFLITYLGKVLTLGASASIIATGVTGLVLLLNNYFTDSRDRDARLLYDSGLRKAFDGRSVLIKSEYASRLASARQIDIIGFGLAAFRQDYGDRFAELAQSAHVRILLLHPSFPPQSLAYSVQRDREENNPDGTIKSDVEAFLNKSLHVRQTYPDRFSVRLLTSLPSINYFRLGNEALWGPYLAEQPSRNMPTFLVSSSGFLFEKLNSHFESIWASNTLSTSCDNLNQHAD